MRASVLATALLFGAALPAAAGGARHQAHHAPAPPISAPVTRTDVASVPLNLNLGLHMLRPTGSDDDLRLRRQSAEATESNVSFSVGPLRTKLGGDGKKMSIARYHLEDMDLFGGSISGRVDGRGARVYVRWPPSDDD